MRKLNITLFNRMYLKFYYFYNHIQYSSKKFIDFIPKNKIEYEDNNIITPSKEINNNDVKYKKLEEELIKEKNNNKSLNEIINILKMELSDEKDKVKQLMNTNKSLKDIEKILEDELNKEREKFNDLQKKFNDLKKEVNKNLNMHNSSNGIESLNPGEKAIAINFSSINQKISNFCLVCKNTDIFVKLEEKLYNEYPEYKDIETYFMANGNKIKRFKTLEENKINNGNNIVLHIYEE